MSDLPAGRLWAVNCLTTAVIVGHLVNACLTAVGAQSGIPTHHPLTRLECACLTDTCWGWLGQQSFDRSLLFWLDEL